MLLWAARLALLAAAVSAVALARFRADHRPFAAFLAWITLANALRAVLAVSFGLIRPLDSPPFTGFAHIAFHIDEAIGLSGPAALAITTILLFVRRRYLAILPAIVWLGGVAYVSINYPALRGEALRRVYLAAELAGLTIASGSIITWIWRREAPTPARICTLAVCFVDGGLLFVGAQRWGFWQRQDLEQACLTLVYLTITAFQVYVWRSPSR